MIRSRKPGADPAAVLCGRARHTGRRGELGTAIIEVTWLGLLLMIPLVYVIVTLVTVQRSAFGATEAARAAGRAFILAPDPVTARERAYEAARLAMLDQGAPFEPANLVLECGPTPDACLQPGSSVLVTVDLDVRLPLVPSVFGRPAGSIAVAATHTELYGTFREGSP